MEQLLLNLLGELGRIGLTHEELYDSEVREQMGIAIMEGFVRRNTGYRLPERFGMFSTSADKEVRSALGEYLKKANARADEIGLTSFHSRLAAFQNREVRTNPETDEDYEEFFGHTAPEWYDGAGNILWDRVR